MNKFLKHISTDYDNQTFDVGRCLVILIILTMIGLEVFDVVFHAHAFDVQAFGTGTSAILIGLGMYLFGDGKAKPTVNNP
jgi:hypothetical protein